MRPKVFKPLEIWWTLWSSRQHPVLLALATAVAAIVAVILMVGMVDAPIVLYKEF